MDQVPTCAWWPSWIKDIRKYSHSSERYQKANKATSKIFCLMIHIQEPSTPWEVAHMDWLTSVPLGGEKSYNTCLVVVGRCSKNPILFPCHKDKAGMDTSLLIWKRVISPTGLFKYIISDRYPEVTSASWTNLNKLFGTRLSFSTAYHPHTDGLAERMIQTLESMVRLFCAYALEFEYSYGFTHYWNTHLPALELACKTYIHASTGKTPAMLEKGFNSKLPVDTFRKGFN
ncbi:hypothetical protein O181_125245 [Austropuccinia psidii MF-1]|uniref:Integrase catalytic domain-containing protein n=1 Tax=Austropuccinia psidii MF-1 TaxID=1389203 RepID=A0A9Q3Q5X6_9BASI|nr:hypothetical protein [Austropuccinia psidii MF-1]